MFFKHCFRKAFANNNTGAAAVVYAVNCCKVNCRNNAAIGNLQGRLPLCFTHKSPASFPVLTLPRVAVYLTGYNREIAEFLSPQRNGLLEFFKICIGFLLLEGGAGECYPIFSIFLFSAS